jgi:hypothetical protein
MGVDLLDDGEQRSHQIHPPMNIALATPLFVLAGAIVILSFARFLINLQHRRRLRAIIRDEDQEKFTQRSGLMASLNKHVFYAPILSTRHSREFRVGKVHMGTVPLRIETILLTGYIGINLAFFVSLIDWWKDYQEVLYQLKYAAGHLAVMNTPGLVLTAGRNNPLIPLLGTQFDSFNLIHRWVGRLVVVGSIVHVSCVVVAKVAESKSSLWFLALSGLSLTLAGSMQETANAIWHIPFFIYGMVVSSSTKVLAHCLIYSLGLYRIPSHPHSIRLATSTCFLRSFPSPTYPPSSSRICGAMVSCPWAHPAIRASCHNCSMGIRGEFLFVLTLQATNLSRGPLVYSASSGATGVSNTLLPMLNCFPEMLLE